MSRKIEDLCEKMQPLVRKAIEQMQNDHELKWLGVEGIYINETLRTMAVQMAYWSRGRMAIGDVKEMYRAAGLYNITDEEAMRPNTWTLHSKHLEGKAIDLVPMIHGKISWNPPVRVWERMGEIGKENGLIWGGYWKEKDYPHFEIM